jgi:hypothetical protein
MKNKDKHTIPNLKPEKSNIYQDNNPILSTNSKEYQEFVKNNEFLDFGFGNDDIDIGPMMEVFYLSIY